MQFFFRNIHTRDILSKSQSTIAAKLVGNISSKEAKHFSNEKKNVQYVLKPFKSGQTCIDLPLKITHQDKNRCQVKDTENVHEIYRLHNGQLKTDRYVLKETVKDQCQSTPEEGPYTDNESYAEDAQRYVENRDESFVDYYQVKEKKDSAKKIDFLTRGLHLSTHNKKQEPFHVSFKK